MKHLILKRRLLILCALLGAPSLMPARGSLSTWFQNRLSFLKPKKQVGISSKDVKRHLLKKNYTTPQALNNALFQACITKDFEEIGSLLQQGVDPHFTSFSFSTFDTLILEYKSHFDTIVFLLEQGVLLEEIHPFLFDCNNHEHNKRSYINFFNELAEYCKEKTSLVEKIQEAQQKIVARLDAAQAEDSNSSYKNKFD